MNRYFHYLVITPMVGSVVLAIPSLLFEMSKKGAIVSMVISLFVGLAFIFFITKFFNKYPGRGFPELLKQRTPRWFSFFILYMISLIWFSLGLQTLVGYSFLLKRFLTPNIEISWIAITFLLFISYGILMESKSILYLVEVILFINLPVILFIMEELITSKGLKWDYIRKSAMYFFHAPNYLAFSASLFLFLGATSLIIFNREFKKKQKITFLQLVFLGVLGAGALFAAYFIPIGYNGFDHIQYITFPWLLTADSMRVSLAFLERVMYIVLLLYLAIAFLNIIIFWHVSLETLKSIIWLKRFKWRKHNLTPYIIVLGFWVISLLVINFMSEYQFIQYFSYLVNILPAFFLLFIIICWFIGRRKNI